MKTRNHKAGWEQIRDRDTCKLEIGDRGTAKLEIGTLEIAYRLEAWVPMAHAADALKLEIAAKAPSFVSFTSALLVSLAGGGCGGFAARRGVKGQGRTRH